MNIDNYKIYPYNYEVCTYKFNDTLITHILTDKNIYSITLSFNSKTYNNMGIKHILEHLILKGSSKYPYSNLEIKQISTANISGETTPENINFSISAYLEEDFFNALKWLLEAIVHPIFVENKELFLVEGWRKNQDKINGVVYNEMKNVSYVEDTFILQSINENYYNDSCHLKYSPGGKILDIVNSNVNDVIELYDRDIKLENAKIVIAGEIRKEDLEQVFSQYLFSNNDMLKYDLTSDVLKNKDCGNTIYINYPAKKINNTLHSIFTINYFNNSKLTYEKNYLLSFITYYLNNSSLQKILIEQGLASNIKILPVAYSNSSLISFRFYNVDKENTNKVIDVLNKNILRIIEDISLDSNIGIINNYKRNLKNELKKIGKKNILTDLTYRMANRWSLGLNPWDNKMKDILNLQNNIFSDIGSKLRELFDDSEKTMIYFSPDENFMKNVLEHEKELSEKLELSPKIKIESKIDIESSKLFNKENSKILNKFELWKDCSENNINDVLINGYFANTNGFIRMFFVFDLSKLNDMEKVLTKVICSILNQKFKQDEIATIYCEICEKHKINTSEILNIFIDINYEDIDYIPKIINELYSFTIIDMDNIIKEIIKKIKFDVESRYLKTPYIKLMDELYESVDETYLNKMKHNGLNCVKLLDEFLRRENLSFELNIVLNKVKNNLNNIDYICDEDKNNDLKINTIIGEIINILKENLNNNIDDETITSTIFENNDVFDRIENLLVNSVGFAIKLSDVIANDICILPLEKLINKYLISEVRIKGGAYAVTSHIGNNNDLMMLSTMDPNITETMDKFRNISNYLKQVNDFEISQAVVSSFKQIICDRYPNSIYNTIEQKRIGFNKETYNNYINSLLNFDKNKLNNLIEIIENKLNNNKDIKFIAYD